MLKLTPVTPSADLAVLPFAPSMISSVHSDSLSVIRPRGECDFGTEASVGLQARACSSVTLFLGFDAVMLMVSY